MKILVKDLIQSLDYKLSYFHKILTQCNVKSRIILDEDDIRKILSCHGIKNQKSYNLYITLKNMLDSYEVRNV